MNVEHNVEYKEHSSARVTVTVKKAEAQKNYDQLLNKYTKEASLPGFRKGKVPKAMLESKYGEGIKAEALNDLIDAAMREVFPKMERQVLGYAQPELESEPELDFTKDISFSLLMDVEPEFKTPEYKGLSSVAYKISVTEDDIAKELKTLQDRNALVVEKSGKAIKGDLLTVNYAELAEDGSEIVSSKREGFVFTIGEGNTYYSFDDDVIGMSKDEEKTIEKSFAADHEHSDLAGRNVKLKIKVTAVKERKTPDLDDEFAQDINEKFKNLADLKADIKDKLQVNADASAKNKQINDLIKSLAASTAIDLPESMIKAESDMRFSNFARQSGFGEENLLRMLGGNKEGLSERWREESIESVKSRLILDRILKESAIEASKEELDEEMNRLSEEYKMSVADMQKQFGGNGFVQYVKNDIEDRKLHDYLLESAKVTETKEITLAQFVELANEEQNK